MKNKKSKRILLLLVILLLVSVGFAILSRQLNIFGLSNIAASKWLIHWDNVANEDGMRPTTHAYIKDLEKKIVEFEVNFDTPGQYYEFTVDAVNEGTMDADLVEIISTVNDGAISTLPAYIVYEVKYANGVEPTVGDILPKKVGDTPGRQPYKVSIKYDENLLTNELYEEMPDELNYTFKFSVKYSQRGVPPHVPDNFEDDPWEVIADEGPEAAEQEEVVNGKCGHYNVGDTRKIYLDMDDDGQNEEYTLRIANCSTPPECKTSGFSQTACGFVIEFADEIAIHRASPYDSTYVNGDGNIGGWQYSEVRAWLNSGTFALENTNFSTTGVYNKLPAELRKLIVDTTVVSGHGCAGDYQYSSYSNSYYCIIDDNNGNNFVTTDKLYLLAAHELWEDGEYVSAQIQGNDTGYFATRQLDYYAMQGLKTGSGTYTAGIKQYQGNNKKWLLRSTNSLSKSDYFAAYEHGNWGYNSIWAGDGISPAFKVQY